MLKFEMIKKEFKEYLRTPKGLILLILFLFFAISSPALAKYMNEILAAVAGDIQISFPDPTLQDAWIQFYKNMNSICIIVYLIVMTGTVSQEKNKGSILLVLTKKITRLQLLLSKFIVGSVVFTILFFASSLLSGLYTQTLFGAFSYDGLVQSLILTWLMGLFFTALALFVSVVGKTPTTSALLGFFGFAVLQVLNISMDLAMFNPAGASSIVNGIITGSVEIIELWLPMLSAIIATIGLVFCSYMIFKRQEI